MTNITADNFFHGPEKYNCCQAVLKYAQINNYRVSDELLLEAKRYGGGRADNNMCGALHALRIIFENEEKQFNSLAANFSGQCGSTSCKEIKQLRLASCSECVKIAGKILDTQTA